MITRALVASVLCFFAAGCGDSPTAPSPTATTFLSFTSDSGDWIGQGKSYRYGVSDGTWEARLDPRWNQPEITVRIQVTSQEWWSLTIAAPEGQSLAVGTYEGAMRFPFQDRDVPGLAFMGSSRACNRLTGRFVISELSMGAGNTVDRLHVTFEQHCEGGSAAARGEVSVVANPWR